GVSGSRSMSWSRRADADGRAPMRNNARPRLRKAQSNPARSARTSTTMASCCAKSMRVTEASGAWTRLLLDVQEILRDLVERADDLRVRLVGALVNDQVRELLGDVDSGVFERAAV